MRLPGFFTRGGLFHIIFEYAVGLDLLFELFQRILTHAVLEVPEENWFDLFAIIRVG